MAGYIIGLVLGIVIFILQFFKPSSGAFRATALLSTVAFMWIMGKTHLGYWNILIIPIGVVLICFIAAVFFPYRGKSATYEYDSINGKDYYDEIGEHDKIGLVNAPGFKQTYDRIMSGLLFEVAHSKAEFQDLQRLLYSKNFYPISQHTKVEVLEHIVTAIQTAIPASANSLQEEYVKRVFNTYVAIMSIHEDTTRAIEELKDNQKTGNF